MPKAKLGRNPTLERQEATRKVIRRAIAERGICSQRELAQKMGKTDSSFSRKFRTNSWKIDDIALMAGILRLTESDAAIILGIK